MDRSVPCDTRAAYDALAAVYDDLTAHHDHERWLTLLLDLAGDHGLAGRRVLDVGCGTGKSFMPLVRRGFDVTACDISPRMAARARRRARGPGGAPPPGGHWGPPPPCPGGDIAAPAAALRGRRPRHLPRRRRELPARRRRAARRPVRDVPQPAPGR